MKVFKNSSPEFQMLLLFFLLVTILAYFLLILYGIIWKQKGKQILINMAIFSVTFLIVTCLVERYPSYYREQKPCLLFEIPYFIYAAAAICGMAYAAVQARVILRQEKKYLQGNAIQGSLDNLPSGVGFFDEQGMPVLINRQMHRISRCLTGRDLQSAAELRDALEHPSENGVPYDPDFQVYFFEDGSVWKFSEDAIVTENGERFLQFLASEVSELYQNKLLLENENRKLQEISVAMKELSKNIVTLTREEETLAMKMRIHDDLGYSVLAAHRMLLQDSEERGEVFLSQWNRILNLLRKNNEPAAGELSQTVQERADSLGVKLFYVGEMPDDPEIARLMDSVLLEAISNCVRHGEATELYVKISSELHEWMFEMTNNGRKPDREIVEGGGLSAIRKNVGNYNGSVRICSFPEYSLTIKIPKKEEGV